jgi:hypothetical protein
MHLIRQRLKSEEGFAMAAVMAVMFIATLIAAAAVASTDSDRVMSTNDKVRKQAYAAAEAGVNDYLARLVANVDYWRNCGDDPAGEPNPSLNFRITSPTDPRNWRPIGGNASYSVEVLPANGATQCTTADPIGTFIDSTTGTFRIRSTGQVNGDPDSRRSVVATFRRRGFLDFVYFTDFETLAPEWYIRDARGQENLQRDASGNPIAGSPDVVTWAKDPANGCSRYYRKGRDPAVYRGVRRPSASSAWTAFDVGCGEINFVNGDQQRGPFHTNDEILVCGSPGPAFGRRPSDEVEISAPEAGGVGSATGWRNCGSGAPQVNDPTDTTPDPNLGTLRISSPPVEMPPRNTSLRGEALPRYRFVGRARFDMEGDTMRAVDTVTREDGTTIPAGQSVDIPRDGVVYVSNSSTAPCGGYNPRLAEHTVGMAGYEGCGDLWIQGDYNHSVTFGADNDIVVENSVTHDAADDVLLGLIANEWIRVHHRTGLGSEPYTSCSNTAGGPTNMRIEAALLALNDSFTVDRYFCGGSLGTLTVVGAIAQKFRGPVGTSGGTGYIKNYQYDDRLRFRTPPKFLDPVRASWRIQTQVEQVPAT